MSVDPENRPPVTVPYAVAFERLTEDLAQSLTLKAVTAYAVGSMSLAELEAQADAYDEPRQLNGMRLRRSMTAMTRENGLREEAKARAGYRLRRIVAQVRAASC